MLTGGAQYYSPVSKLRTTGVSTVQDKFVQEIQSVLSQYMRSTQSNPLLNSASSLGIGISSGGRDLTTVSFIDQEEPPKKKVKPRKKKTKPVVENAIF